MCKVSVVIPIYNVEKYLNEALESIMMQTYSNLEIILVNDGSTDNSLEIAKYFLKKDKRFVLIDQKNGGLSNARNSGLKIATGKYIYFFDSDDILEIKAIEECINLAEENNLDLVLFDAQSFIENIENKTDIKKYKMNKSIQEYKLYSGSTFIKKENYHVSSCLKFIKFDILKNEKIDFYDGILHEDELFSARVFLSSKRTMYIRKEFFKRRIRKGSIMTSSKTKKNIEGYLICCRELKKLLHKISKSEKKYLIQRINRLCQEILYICITNTISEKKYYLKIIWNEFKSMMFLKTIVKLKCFKIYSLYLKNKFGWLRWKRKIVT